MSGHDFITLQRRVLDSWLWDMPAEQGKVALTLLMMANWKEGQTFSSGKLVTVKRGQVMTSIQAISTQSRVSFKTVRTSLKNLEAAGYLASTATNRFRLITILNYAKHQSRQGSLGHPSDESAASQGQPAGKQRASHGQATGNDRTREQSNNCNKGTNDSTCSPVGSQPEFELEHPVAGKPKVTLAALEAVYQLYPLKKGKAKGLEKAQELIKTQADFERYQACVEHMAKAFAADKTYCPHFSTFVNQELWLDDDWPSPRSAPEAKSVGHYQHTGEENYAGGDVEI